MATKKFLYFAYCVNMLGSRMEGCVDTSVIRRGFGKVRGWKLLFGSYSDEWEGCLATIVKSNNLEDAVWGVLWELEESMKPRLDKLQQVSRIYEQVEIDVTVYKNNVSTLKAVTYRLAGSPSGPLLVNDVPRMKDRPSKLYLEEMVQGAQESNLPIYYQKWLRTVHYNGSNNNFKSKEKLPSQNIFKVKGL